MIDIDGVRVRDISPSGLLLGGFMTLLGGGLAVGSVVTAGGLMDAVVGTALGLLVVAFGLFFAYHDIAPEFEGPCENCGSPIVANSGAADVTTYVKKRKVGEPRRLTVGDASIVLRRRKRTDVYCSSNCAQEHETFLLHPPEHETLDERLEVNDAD